MSDSAVPEHAVVSDGYRLAWTETGTGVPVVLVHSGGLSGRQWRRLAQQLSADHRVIVPDLLGYGDSSPWPDGVAFHFRQDLAALDLLLKNIGEPAHLVGHSYGGFLAMLLALADSSRFRAIAVFEPVTFGVLDPAADADALEGLADVRLEWSRKTPDGVDEEWLEGFVDWWNGPGAWSALASEVKNAFRAAGWKVFQEVVSLLSDHTPLEAYAAIGNRVLLMGAGKSPLAERRVLKRLASVIPHSTLTMFEGVGHMAPVTHSAAVNRAIAVHLNPS